MRGRIHSILLLVAIPVAFALAPMTAACVLPTHRLIETTDVFEHPGLPRVELRLHLLRVEERQAPRYLAAAKAALRYYGEWFGPVEESTLVMSSADAAQRIGVEALVVDVGLIAPAPSGRFEQEIFSALAMRQWRDGADAPDVPFREGIAAFAADRAIRTEFLSGPFAEVRALNDVVPWVVRAVDATSPHRTRAMLALTTLERFIGWSALQPVLASLYQRRASRAVTPATFVSVAQELTGRELHWVSQLFDTAHDYDHAVDRVDVQRIDARTFRSTVSVRQHGSGAFGPVPVVVRFADGQMVTEHLRSHVRHAEFVYDAGAAAIEAVLDPDHILALDSEPANNAWSADASRGVTAARSWAARWGIWLQDRLLLWSTLL